MVEPGDRSVAVIVLHRPAAATHGLLAFDTDLRLYLFGQSLADPGDSGQFVH
jgi:hypothetical protein